MIHELGLLPLKLMIGNADSIGCFHENEIMIAFTMYVSSISLEKAVILQSMLQKASESHTILRNSFFALDFLPASS